MKTFTEKAVDYFTQKNWRITVAVRAILNLLEEAETMLSVRAIQRQLKQKEKIINTSTVYRILERLESSHLIHAFERRWKVCSYPENTTDEHHFLICDQCQRVEEIFLDYKSAIAEQLAQEKKFLLKKVHLGFFGICKNCQKKN